MSKRQDYASWQETFMNMALVIAKRSKDPSTQVGACIVNSDNHIVALGYNGFPSGCSDDDLPWEKEGGFLETKYPYVVHAELNAILNATTSLKGAHIYVSLFPCNECTKAIIQSQITEIFYLDDKNINSPQAIASKKMLNLANIKYTKLDHEF